MNKQKVSAIILGLFFSFTMFSASNVSAETESSLFDSVRGKQYVTFGISTGAIPFYNEVFVFNSDGSFVLKKLENYGKGEYYLFFNNFFYFIFNNRSGIDIQYVEGFGFSVFTPIGSIITGFGVFMIDYKLAPTLFMGLEVFQE